jgi:hypothetical protein
MISNRKGGVNEDKSDGDLRIAYKKQEKSSKRRG